MQKKLVQASVVILADSHNPGILSAEYMKNLGLINEAPSNFVHTPLATVLEYGDRKLSFAVIPDRFSATLLGNLNRDRVSELVGIVGHYFRSLPVTPVTASGLNLSASLVFDSRESQASFQEAWLQPKRVADYFEGLDTLWGSTAVFHWHSQNIIVSVKLEPTIDKSEISVLMNAHIPIRSVEGNVKTLEQNYLDLFAFFEKLLSGIN